MKKIFFLRPSGEIWKWSCQTYFLKGFNSSSLMRPTRTFTPLVPWYCLSISNLRLGKQKEALKIQINLHDINDDLSQLWRLYNSNNLLPGNRDRCKDPPAASKETISERADFYLQLLIFYKCKRVDIFFICIFLISINFLSAAVTMNLKRGQTKPVMTRKNKINRPRRQLFLM